MMLVETSAANSLKSVTFPMYPDANGNITDYLQFQVSNFTFQVSTVAHFEYSPFGQVTFQSGEMADSFAYKFSTKYYCPELNMSDFGMRWYSPEVGRFISQDPIEESGGVMLYGYCGNDGVNGWDLLGMEFNVTTEFSWGSWNRSKMEIGFPAVTVRVKEVTPFVSSQDNCCKRFYVWDINVNQSGKILYFFRLLHETDHVSDFKILSYDATFNYGYGLMRYYTSMEEVKCWVNAWQMFANLSHDNAYYQTIVKRDLTQWGLIPQERSGYERQRDFWASMYWLDKVNYDKQVKKCEALKCR